MVAFLNRHKISLIYGVLLAVLLFFLKWVELRFIIYTHAFEIYAGVIAVLFTAVGIWLALKLMKPKQVVIEKEVYVRTENFVRNEKAIKEFELSQRELEVLEWMGKGLSNAEIAAQLFVSLNTVKTHTANLFFKLDVKRRTQAVEKAKRLGILQ